MKRWYAVQTQSCAEEKARFHLSAQGFHVYLPRFSKQRRHARKVETVLRALFPGYVFVELDLEVDQWRSINGTVGAIGMVRHGDKPAPIPCEIIEAIKEREDETGAVSLAPKGLTKGDRVRVMDGAFAEHTGILQEVSDEKRVILLLNLLGRQIRVTAPAEALAIAS